MFWQQKTTFACDIVYNFYINVNYNKLERRHVTEDAHVRRIGEILSATPFMGDEPDGENFQIGAPHRRSKGIALCPPSF